MNKKEWKEVTKKMIESFPTDTLVTGKLEDKGLLVIASLKGFDWLNKKMFDYCKDDESKAMIEKGLALEAPEGMYKV